MAFEDVVAKLTGENIGDVAELVQELTAEHEKALGVHQAKITTLATDLDAYKEREIALKATNYDLLMKVPADNQPEPEPKPEAKPNGVSALFQSKE